MQYCEQGDLYTAIKNKNGKPFPNSFLWKIFIHISLGLHYLHARNYVHRDIKSLNVFITKDKEAKLGDFGNIKKIKETPKVRGDNLLSNSSEGLERIGEEQEAEGQTEDDDEDEEVERVGTPYYLAPELWQKQHQTKASDIWALGVLVYEMCAHKYPYDAQDIDELEEKVKTKKYTPIPQGVTKDFNMIIKQCLMKKPENRATIDEIIFSDDFQDKAKVNKITLPRHLNKQKLIQSLGTKRILDSEEHKLIQGLIDQGLLPKDTENTPAMRYTMEQASLEEVSLSTALQQKSNGDH